MFQLSKPEWNELITNCDNLGSREFSPTPPFVFSEQGVAMLSSVLNSKRAIQVNIAIMRAFVQKRKFMQSNDVLAKKLDKLEKETSEKFAGQQKQIQIIFETIKQLISDKEKPGLSTGGRRKIGF